VNSLPAVCWRFSFRGQCAAAGQRSCPCQEESLAQSARWAAERRVNHFAGLALAVSGQEAIT
jgi:hypothetical protein